jgi:hypothetical protein
MQDRLATGADVVHMWVPQVQQARLRYRPVRRRLTDHDADFDAMVMLEVRLCRVPTW